MKTQQVIGTTSIAAAAELAVGLFCGFDGNICAANARALGVVGADTGVGNQAPINYAGVLLVKSGGIIAVGDPLVSDSAGKAVKATTFAAAAPAVTVDASKLSIASGATPVTSTAANGASLITAASGFLTPAAPALTGSILPQAINGYALDVASGADEWIRMQRV